MFSMPLTEAEATIIAQAVIGAVRLDNGRARHYILPAEPGPCPA
jgi:hypothetical protein